MLHLRLPRPYCLHSAAPLKAACTLHTQIKIKQTYEKQYIEITSTFFPMRSAQYLQRGRPLSCPLVDKHVGKYRRNRADTGKTA